MSQKKQYTMSLSRAMKVAERLAREADKQASENLRSVIPMTLSFAEQAEKITLRMENLNEGLASVEAFDQAVADIRLAVAKKNEEVGLHGLLTQHKLLCRQRSRLSSLIDNIDMRADGAIEVEHAVKALERQQENNPRASVEVLMVGADGLQALKRKLSSVSAQIDALLDRQNDINTSNRITISLDEDLAQAVGLE